jgi:hypothetical protein
MWFIKRLSIVKPAANDSSDVVSAENKENDQ